MSTGSLLFLAEHPAPSVVLMLGGANDIFDPSVMPAQISRALSLLPESGPDGVTCRSAAPHRSGCEGRRSAQHRVGQPCAARRPARGQGDRVGSPAGEQALTPHGIPQRRGALRSGVAYHNAIIQQGLGEAGTTAMTRPRGYCWGPTARDVQFAQGVLRSVITGVVVDFEWSWIQPSNPAALDPAAVAQVHAWLDWCETNTGVTGKPLQVHLRPRVGLYALTSYARQPAPCAGGSTAAVELPGRHHGRTSTLGRPKLFRVHRIRPTAPLRRDAPLVDAVLRERSRRCTRFRLWQEFEARTIVVEVDYGWPSTHYMEPCLKQWSIQDNLEFRDHRPAGG